MIRGKSTAYTYYPRHARRWRPIDWTTLALAIALAVIVTSGLIRGGLIG